MLEFIYAESGAESIGRPPARQIKESLLAVFTKKEAGGEGEARGGRRVESQWRTLICHLRGKGDGRGFGALCGSQCFPRAALHSDAAIDKIMIMTFVRRVGGNDKGVSEREIS